MLDVVIVILTLRQSRRGVTDCFWPIRNKLNSTKVITTVPGHSQGLGGGVLRAIRSTRSHTAMMSHEHGPIFTQVNRSPSFGTDTKLDSEIKGGALCDALKLLNIRYFLTSLELLPGNITGTLACQLVPDKKRSIAPRLADS